MSGSEKQDEVVNRELLGRRLKEAREYLNLSQEEEIGRAHV